MDRFMAFPAHHKCFAPRLLEISEFAHMVNLYFFFRSAEFTPSSENPLQQFTPLGQRELGLMVNKDCLLLSFKSSIVGLLCTDHAVITVMLHFSPLCWFAFAHIQGAFLFNDCFGYS